ncbi:MAG: hypothetical protein ACJ8CR_02295 [Roseiflexaceae bacterium]
MAPTSVGLDDNDEINVVIDLVGAKQVPCSIAPAFSLGVLASIIPAAIAGRTCFAQPTLGLYPTWMVPTSVGIIGINDDGDVVGIVDIVAFDAGEAVAGVDTVSAIHRRGVSE